MLRFNTTMRYKFAIVEVEPDSQRWTHILDAWTNGRIYCNMWVNYIQGAHKRFYIHYTLSALCIWRLSVTKIFSQHVSIDIHDDIQSMFSSLWSFYTYRPTYCSTGTFIRVPVITWHTKVSEMTVTVAYIFDLPFIFGWISIN